MDRVTVWWDDSHSVRDYATEEEVDALHRPMVLGTTGWVVRQDKKGVTLAGDYHAPELNEGLNPDRWRHLCFIPRRCITKIDYLEPKAR